MARYTGKDAKVTAIYNCPCLVSSCTPITDNKELSFRRII